MIGIPPSREHFDFSMRWKSDYRSIGRTLREVTQSYTTVIRKCRIPIQFGLKTGLNTILATMALVYYPACLSTRRWHRSGSAHKVRIPMEICGSKLRTVPGKFFRPCQCERHRHAQHKLLHPYRSQKSLDLRPNEHNMPGPHKFRKMLRSSEMFSWEFKNWYLAIRSGIVFSRRHIHFRAHRFPTPG